ncbi:MAG: hypothetical protein CR967_02980 [Proteobacteria bacterium]|nr:MAG: hypothetical protein CR967_02980 [Pseudomonadota bacterium]
MKTHTVIDIKITYELEHMSKEQEKDMEEKIKTFLESIKNKQGVKIKAKRHNVAVQNMIDEYGINLEDD